MKKYLLMLSILLPASYLIASKIVVNPVTQKVYEISENADTSRFTDPNGTDYSPDIQVIDGDINSLPSKNPRELKYLGNNKFRKMTEEELKPIQVKNDLLLDAYYLVTLQMQLNAANELISTVKNAGLLNQISILAIGYQTQIETISAKYP